MELAIVHSPHLGRANAKSTAKNDARNLQLQVRTKLLLSIFTGKKLEGKGGTGISVALIDGNTRDVISSGPESSVKLDVVVLEGDFNKEDEENWAQEEFEKYMVKERQGKGQLLTGKLLVTLKGGVGELGELIFTDNSSWTRSKKFRIGLKVASGFCENTRIREGRTNAFRVKEHRGESSEKHHPPASDDAVWRLEKIAKDGKYHQKLSKFGIDKVEDFLLQLFTDSDKLREILGKSLKSKNWDILVHHAKTCKTGWKLFLYASDDERKHGAVFEIDGQLIAVIKDRVCCATHRLSAQEKEHGDTIVRKAFDNWNNVMEFNGETFSGSMQKKSSSSFPSQFLQNENFTPVQCNLVPQVHATPGGPEAPPEYVGFTAEGPSQNTGDYMGYSFEDIFSLVEHQPTLTVGEPIESYDTDLLRAMCIRMTDSSSQMHLGNEIVLSSEPSYYANHVMEHFHSTNADVISKDIRQYGDGSIRSTSKGVKCWLKIKAVMRWGIFVRKRGVRIVQLDEPHLKSRLDLIHS
ncbi:hypothetical protein BT93_E2422 [Corymbia citriodora subsp. variegata]|nr:hypothetical protein BT93_E2422 [Corymbia citriodora subsp. variegata]